MRAWKGVRGGTPSNERSLCETCEYAHIVTGEATSEKVTYCNAMDKPIPVPYKKVVECSRYNDKHSPSIYQMEKIAYVMLTDPKGKPIGFRSNSEFRKAAGLKEHDDLTHHD